MTQKSQFNIKVSDLLKETGKQDSIDFTELKTKNIPGLTSEGVSGTVSLESQSKKTIQASFTDIQCQINDTCEACSSEYTRQVRCDFHEVKFTLDKSQYDNEAQDEIFPIDEKSNIDLEDVVVQAIGLQTPTTKLCYDCINKQESDNDDYSSLDYFENGDNIQFN